MSCCAVAASAKSVYITAYAPTSDLTSCHVTSPCSLFTSWNVFSTPLPPCGNITEKWPSADEYVSPSDLVFLLQPVATTSATHSTVLVMAAQRSNHRAGLTSRFVLGRG